jgi:hypothetical protein
MALVSPYRYIFLYAQVFVTTQWLYVGAFVMLSRVWYIAIGGVRTLLGSILDSYYNSLIRVLRVGTHEITRQLSWQL